MPTAARSGLYAWKRGSFCSPRRESVRTKASVSPDVVLRARSSDQRNSAGAVHLRTLSVRHTQPKRRAALAAVRSQAEIAAAEVARRPARRGTPAAAQGRPSRRRRLMPARRTGRRRSRHASGAALTEHRRAASRGCRTSGRHYAGSSCAGRASRHGTRRRRGSARRGHTPVAGAFPGQPGPAVRTGRPADHSRIVEHEGASPRFKRVGSGDASDQSRRYPFQHGIYKVQAHRTSFYNFFAITI